MLVTLLSIVLGTGTGWSYWTAAATGWGSADTGTLTAPTDVVATIKAGSAGTVVVTWTASVVSGGAPDGYRVTRIDSQSGNSSFACGTSMSDLIGAPTCEDQPPQDGDHHYRVTAVHQTWTEVSDPSGPVTVDTAAPPAPVAPDLVASSDSGTSETDDLTNDATPTFTGTAEVGATVTLYVASMAVGAGVVAADGTYAVTTTASLADDIHTLTARATDAAGNVGQASPGTLVTVDTLRPAVTVEQEAGQDDPTNDEPIRFAVVFSEPVSGFTIEDVESGPPSAATIEVTGSGAAYEVAVSGVADGTTVSISVAADAVTDAAGNANTASTSDDGSVTFDATAPAAPSTPDLHSGSDSGASATDDITNDTTPTFVGGAEPGSTVTIYSGGGNFLGEGTAGVDGSYSVQVQADHELADGVHEVSAMATDLAGNTAVSTDQLSLVVDTVAPDVAITQATYSVTIDPDGQEEYHAQFVGRLGAHTYDDGFTILLCTSTACDTAVPGPMVEVDGTTWSRSSDPVYSCSTSGARVCTGTDPVHAVASQVDRAGNSAVVTNEMDFPEAD